MTSRWVRACATFVPCIVLGACASASGADDAATSAFAAQKAAARPAANDAKSWLGSDPGAFADQLIAQIRSFERPVDDDQALLGTTWDAELARARARFVAAKTKTDVYYALVSLQNSAHDPHSHYGPRDIPQALLPTTPPVAVNLDVRVEYDQAGGPLYVVTADGAPPSSVIETVDGTAIADFEAATREWYPLHEPGGLREMVARAISHKNPAGNPAPAPGTTTTLGLRAPDGTEGTLSRTWQVEQEPDHGGADEDSMPPCCSVFGTQEARRDYSSRTPVASGQNWCTYTTDRPDVVVARACSFLYQDDNSMKRDQANLLSALHDSGASNVLFDVRENGGGSFDPAFFAAFTDRAYAIPMKRLYFAPGLRADPQQVSQVTMFLDPMPSPEQRLADEMQQDPAAQYSTAYPFFCQTASCGPDEATYPPGNSPPAWTVALLSGPFCVSACDDFVSIVKDNGMGTLVGMPSASGDAPFQYALPIAFANGASADLTLTIGDSLRPGTTTILEGHPAAIDVPLPPSADNRGRYLDAAVLAAFP